jgi:hypothetical protein
VPPLVVDVNAVPVLVVLIDSPVLTVVTPVCNVVSLAEVVTLVMVLVERVDV